MAKFIYDRCKDFTLSSTITESYIEKYARETSEKLSIPIETVYETLVEYVTTIEHDCIISKGVELKDYQLQVVRHMFTHRGIIISFDVGKGKTLTAIASALCLVRHASFFKINIKVYIITPTSLQENFKKEMRKFGVDPNSEIGKKFEFYTIVGFVNARKKKQVDCKNALVIIDEAHNLRKDYRMEFAAFKITSDEGDGSRAAEYIKCTAEAWKVILLTATPVYNRTHDVVNLASMVRGDAPLTALDFGIISSNMALFSRYFGCMFAFEKTKTSDFPKREDRFVYIEMTKEYYNKYMDLENKIKGRKQAMLDEKVTNTFMVKLRKATNDLTPCLKCTNVADIILQKKKTIVYSQFLSSGIDLVKKMLDDLGISYREITGKTPKKARQSIVQEINDPKGPNVLLITAAGGEGLDLKGIRNVILMEKGWTVSGEEQVIGRAVRYKSHEHLPPDERLVAVYHLLNVKPWEYREYMATGSIISPVKRGSMDVMSADLYLFKYNRKKEAENIIFRANLESCSLGKKECQDEMPVMDIFDSYYRTEMKKKNL